MIKLSEGELLDILPAQMKYDTDMICLSYALKCGVEKLLAYEKGTMTVNFIDFLPEKILDVLAVEMRSPYYSDAMDIETKRQVIKNSYIWHFKAGTISAVSEMIATIFGEGSVVEWPDFEEGEREPYLFDIETNARLTEDIYEILLSIIERVKNVRSHLRRIKIDRDMSMKEYAGSGVVSSPKIPVTNSMGNRGRTAGNTGRYAAGATGSPRIFVSNTRTARNRAAGGTESHGSGAVSAPVIRLGNTLAQRGRDVSLSGTAAAGAASAPKISIGNTMEGTAGAGNTVRYAAAAMSSPKITIS